MDDREQRRSAKAHLVAVMQRGYSYQAATALAGIQVSQSTAYRLCQAVQRRGETALQDGRHGHPSKLRDPARVFLEAYCRQTPCTPSSVIQTLPQERFGVSMSVSQINRVRASGSASRASTKGKTPHQGKSGVGIRVTKRKEWRLLPSSVF